MFSTNKDGKQITQQSVCIPHIGSDLPANTSQHIIPIALTCSTHEQTTPAYLMQGVPILPPSVTRLGHWILLANDQTSAAQFPFSSQLLPPQIQGKN